MKERNMYNALSGLQQWMHRLGMEICAYNPSTWKAGESEKKITSLRLPWATWDHLKAKKKKKHEKTHPCQVLPSSVVDEVRVRYGRVYLKEVAWFRNVWVFGQNHSRQKLQKQRWRDKVSAGPWNWVDQQALQKVGGIATFRCIRRYYGWCSWRWGR